jgi:GTP cyclohydrolase IB
MQDTQGGSDVREVDLQRVGVKNVELPFKIQEKGGGIQTVLAKVRVSVDLPRHYKGTHMSRFIEILEKWKDQPSSSGQLLHILADTRRRLDASRAHIHVGFKYFVKKQAPVSGQESTMGYDCQFDAMLCQEAGYDLVVGVHVPITTVCPCSKEISVAGAHNQRAWLRVKLRTVPGQFLWLEDLIEQLESFGSCEIYPLVKRPDEKYVTEKGYFNPKFVEDVLRDVVIWLREHPLVTWFEVECEADESIHPHNAFSYQQEPLAGALASFPRDLADVDALDVARIPARLAETAVSLNGRDVSDGLNGTYQVSTTHGPNGAVHPGHVVDDLPDVASSRPRS